MFGQHPGQGFHELQCPPLMGTSATRQTCTYIGSDQVNLDPQMGGLSVWQTPIDSHYRHCVGSSESDAVKYATVFPPRNRELHACLLDHMVR